LGACPTCRFPLALPLKPFAQALQPGCFALKRSTVAARPRGRLHGLTDTMVDTALLRAEALQFLGDSGHTVSPLESEEPRDERLLFGWRCGSASHPEVLAEMLVAPAANRVVMPVLDLSLDGSFVHPAFRQMRTQRPASVIAGAISSTSHF
jgi:hypothetical protein